MKEPDCFHLIRDPSNPCPAKTAADLSALLLIVVTTPCASPSFFFGQPLPLVLSQALFLEGSHKTSLNTLLHNPISYVRAADIISSARVILSAVFYNKAVLLNSYLCFFFSCFLIFGDPYRKSWRDYFNIPHLLLSWP